LNYYKRSDGDRVDSNNDRVGDINPRDPSRERIDQARGLLVRRYDPKMAILDLFVLRVPMLARTHNYRVE